MHVDVISCCFRVDDPRQKDDIESTDILEQYIREKVRAYSRNSTVQKKATYEAFLRSGSKKGEGIAKSNFRKRLRQWGIRPTEECYNAFWRKIDVDRNNKLEFSEFYEFTVEKDYSGDDTAHIYKIARGFTESPGTTMNDVYLANIGARRNKRDTEEVVFKQLDKNGPGARELSVSDIEAVIKNKVRERTRTDASQMVGAFKLFNQPRNGLTKEIFKHKLNQWGIHMKQSTLNELFLRFDTDGNGLLDFNEFLSFVGQFNAHA